MKLPWFLQGLFSDTSRADPLRSEFRIVPTIGIVLGVLALCFSVYSTASTYQFLARGVKASATVLHVEHKLRNSRFEWRRRSHETGMANAATLQFTDREGHLHEGKEIEVYFNPRDTSEHYISEEALEQIC